MFAVKWTLQGLLYRVLSAYEEMIGSHKSKMQKIKQRIIEICKEIQMEYGEER